MSRYQLALVAAGLLLSVPGCPGRGNAVAKAPAHHHHDEEAAEKKEPSDLDLPVEQLLARRCEHGIKAFQCDECRHEVGVVKAPARLFQEGLLQQTRPRLERVAVPLVLTGQVRFDERRVSRVGAPAEGVVRRVFVAIGDRVKKGDALLEIGSVSVGEAEGSHLEAQAALRLAQRNFDRLAELRRDAISSEKDYLLARQELEAAQIRAQASRGKLLRMGLTPREAGRGQAAAQGRLILRAPVEGTVLQLEARVGELARSEATLITVGDSSSLWVFADLYERDLARVLKLQGQSPLQASVSVRAYPGETFAGRLDFISPTMEEGSRMVKVRIAVPNPAARLLVGMFAEVKLFLPGASRVLSLPRSAVLEDEGRSFVFIHQQGDFFVRRPVVVGQSWGQLVEVAGLPGSPSVVSEGAFLLKSDVLRAKMGAGCAD